MRDAGCRVDGRLVSNANGRLGQTKHAPRQCIEVHIQVRYVILHRMEWIHGMDTNHYVHTYGMAHKSRTCLSWLGSQDTRETEETKESKESKES